MRIGFIENNMRLVSSGACNLMMEWYKLLDSRHPVSLLSFSNECFADNTYGDYLIRMLDEDPKKLEEFDILIVNNLGEFSDKFIDALKNCKRPLTYFVYHDRSVIRDIYDLDIFQKYIDACDFVITYQPSFLIDKLHIDPEKVVYMDVTMFYKDPGPYISLESLPTKHRTIDMLFCNRTNNFKGSRYFMSWCHYLREKGNDMYRVIKGFHPDYPHEDVPLYETKDTVFMDKKLNTKLDFYTEAYGDHKRCKELLSKSRFVWLAQDYTKFHKDKFKNSSEYLSYLNYDPDGTTLEAIFCKCIPIAHIANKLNSSFYQNELDGLCIYFDPDKGFDNLYEQYKNFDFDKADSKRADIIDLYKANTIFYNGLMLNLMPKSAFEYVETLAKESAARGI